MPMGSGLPAYQGPCTGSAQALGDALQAAIATISSPNAMRPKHRLRLPQAPKPARLSAHDVICPALSRFHRRHRKRHHLLAGSGIPNLRNTAAIYFLDAHDALDR